MDNFVVFLETTLLNSLVIIHAFSVYPNRFSQVKNVPAPMNTSLRPSLVPTTLYFVRHYPQKTKK